MLVVFQGIVNFLTKPCLSLNVNLILDEATGCKQV